MFVERTGNVGEVCDVNVVPAAGPEFAVEQPVAGLVGGRLDEARPRSSVCSLRVAGGADRTGATAVYDAVFTTTGRPLTAFRTLFRRIDRK